MSIELSRRQFLSIGAGAAATAIIGVPGIVVGQDGKVTLNCIQTQEPGILACGIDTTDAAQTISGGKILQSLVRFDKTNQPEGELAESWTVSEDGLSYTFNLRHNVTWHDGKPFTAADVIFSMTELLPVTHSRTRSILERLDSAEAVDDHTVVLRLKESFLPFLAAIHSINAPILPKHIYEGSDFRQNPANSAPIGTGPFKFGEWRRGQFVQLVRNEEYYVPGEPGVDEIYFYFIPDTAQRTIALETGRGDVMTRATMPQQDIDRLTANGEFAMVKDAFAGLGTTTVVVLNHRNPVLADKRVRQAIAHAVDRQFIIDVALSGNGKLMQGPIASSTRYYDEAAIQKYAFDPDKARSLLDEAELPPGANGIRASFELMGSIAGATRQQIMEIIRQQLLEVGLDVTIVQADLATVSQRDANWDYDAGIAGIGQFFDPAIGVARGYLTQNIVKAYQNNTGGYSNAEVDELWAKAIAAKSEDEAQGYYSKIQTIISEDAVNLWLYENVDIFLASKTVNNIYQGPLSAYYSWAEVAKA